MIDQEDVTDFLAALFVFGAIGTCTAAAIYWAAVLFPSFWALVLIGAACFGAVRFALCVRNAWRRS